MLLLPLPRWTIDTPIANIVIPTLNIAHPMQLVFPVRWTKPAEWLGPLASPELAITLSIPLSH